MWLRILAFSLVVLGIVGCGGSGRYRQVNTDHDKSVDFTAYKTYGWMTPVGEFGLETITGRRVKSGVDSILVAKGFEELTEGKPDFLVRYKLSIEQEVQAYDNYFQWYGGGDWDVRTFDRGTLLLDVIDPEEQKFIWRASASKLLDDQGAGGTLEEILEDMLSSFPPQ
jgi:hypothetical protein